MRITFVFLSNGKRYVVELAFGLNDRIRYIYSFVYKNFFKRSLFISFTVRHFSADSIVSKQF